MKKNIRLYESELVSLVKRIIMEKSEQKLRWSSFTKEQRKKMENLGFNLLINIKNFTKETEDGVKDINHWLEKHNLVIRKPSDDYIIQNIEDIEFALKNLPLSKGKTFLLKKNLKILENQLNTSKKDNYLFYEKNGDTLIWSLVNLYDNNINLWIRLLNKRYTFPGKIDIDSLIDKYFGDCGINTNAGKDIFNAMTNDREILSKEIFEKTWGGGREVEDLFVRFLLKIGIDSNSIRIFAGEGNFVDRAGIDLSIKYNNVYIPIQVKSIDSEAKYSVPEGGISVFPNNMRFYCYDGGEEPIEFKDYLKK